mmetsp:Transcript_96158/g.311849  ORF Transcript_96158/g.311849 Transcript_96158/m.311849 type:complete len:440 (+) Transcript_96158:130-1449(+)
MWFSTSRQWLFTFGLLGARCLPGVLASGSAGGGVLPDDLPGACVAGAVGLFQVAALPKRTPSSHRATSSVAAVQVSAADANPAPPDAVQPSSKTFGAMLTRAAMPVSASEVASSMWQGNATSQSLLGVEATALVEALVALNATAVSEALAAVAADGMDMTWILVMACIMAFLYGLTGMCTHLDDPGHQESLAEKCAHRLADKWPSPLLEDNHPPAISGKLLGGRSNDTPLCLPAASLHAKELLLAGPSWTCDILTHSKQPMFTARFAKVAGQEPQPGEARLEIVGKGASGQPDHVFASIDQKLVIRDPKGAVFGSLVKEHEEYVLNLGKEIHKRHYHWVLSLHHDTHERVSSMAVTWRPEGRVLGTAMRAQTSFFNKSKEHFKVMNAEGVDMVLVLACMLGVMVFELGPKDELVARSALLDFEEEASDWAAGLLQNLQR